MRYDHDGNDIDNHRQYLLEYYQHLSEINFRKNSCLLKYFGESFFHDSQMLLLEFSPLDKFLKIKLTSSNIFEDINKFRKKNGLPDIKKDVFFENPVTFECSFWGVSDYRCSVDFNQSTTIMDTEISSYDRKRGYCLTLSFWEDEEISFYCRKAQVQVPPDKVLYYTDNKRRNIPFCSICRSKLLSGRKIKENISKTIKISMGLPYDIHFR